MKSFVLFIVVLPMVIALSALAASPAAALESVWLVDGAKPAAKDTYIAQGGSMDFEYSEFMGTKIKVKVSCIMIMRGYIAGNKSTANAKLDETTEVLNINETLPLECHFIEEGPCQKSSSPEVTAANLPWLTEIVLSGTKYLDKTTRAGGTANPGWTLTCLVIGVAVTEKCTSNAGVTELTNFLGGVVTVTSSKSLEPNFECIGTGKGSLSLEGEIEAKLGPGETLTVSEG